MKPNVGIRDEYVSIMNTLWDLVHLYSNTNDTSIKSDSSRQQTLSSNVTAELKSRKQASSSNAVIMSSERHRYESIRIQCNHNNPTRHERRQGKCSLALRSTVNGVLLILPFWQCSR